jgi:DNA-binding FadR family transcriptional regulator
MASDANNGYVSGLYRPDSARASLKEMASGQGLTRGIVEKVGRAIVAGEFDAADFPTENELAKRLGVGRNILREAVKILTAKGLLTARPRHGTSVEPESRWNLLDPDILHWMLDRELSVERIAALTEMRLAAEPLAASMAAKRSDRRAYDGVARAVDAVKLAATGRGDPIAADVAFHVAVLDASGNPFFRQLRTLVDTSVRASIPLTWGAKASDRTLDEYERIADAIFAHDAVTAHSSMQAVITDILNILSSARDHRREDVSARAAPDAND